MRLINALQAQAHVCAIEPVDCPTAQLLALARALLKMDVVCVSLVMASGELSFISEAGRIALELDDPGPLIGRDWVSLWPAEERSKVREAFAAAKAGETGSFRAYCPTAKGGTRWWDVVISAVETEAGQPRQLIAVGRDITSATHADERAARGRHLEALGQLIGGVAHDFNNLLTVIIGNSEALSQTLPPGSEAHELANMALLAADKGADLVKRLLAFSRQQSLEPQTVDLADLLEGLSPLIRRTLGEHIRIRVSPPRHKLLCRIDQVELESVLLNLCVNARDAMPEGGELRIDLRRSCGAEFGAAHFGLKDGPFAAIDVTDTGAGMSRETLDRAVEPFFTTKDVGKGTGLGLSSAYGLLQQSGGHLAIDSAPGQGTTVTLYIPMAETEGPAIGRGATAATPLRPHVLLVEDDGMVRAQAARQLKDLGYRVSVATDGRAALERLEDGERFDLLFTDMVMPNGVSGWRLALAARAIDPELKVLFTSGYAAQVSRAGEALDPAFRMLAKPYRCEDLARTVRAALSAPAAPLAERLPS